jgi:hypothetical protein
LESLISPKKSLDTRGIILPPTKSRISARISSELKAKLEMRASSEGVPFNTWMQMHLQELLNEFPGQITIEEGFSFENPYANNPATSAYGPTYGGGYHPPDPIDVMVNDMRKLVMVKLMKEILQDRASPEDVVRARDVKKDDFSFADMMKYNMMQQQMERSYQQQLMAAQAQAEAARGKGDKAGENQALQMITALTTAQMQQQQNFMQQFMLANQNASATQQTLFQTALQTNRASEESARQDRSEFQDRVENVRDQMTQTQLTALQTQGNMQVQYLQNELQRIRDEPKKDMFSQLVELDKLRKDSPVMDAALKAAFGVKEGGGIGDLIPKLKELGVDKVVDKLATALGNLVMRPAIPVPAPPMLPPPTPEELEKLGKMNLTGATEVVPIEAAPPLPTEIVHLPERPSDVGYSNLEKQKGTEGVLVPIEAKEPENIAKIEPTPESASPASPEPEGKVFTTERKPKKG